MAPWAVQADLSDDEFSSGASSASGSGSDSESQPGEDAAAGDDPASAKGKQDRAASDRPSQGSIDCSQELREGPPGESTADGDTAASNGTLSEGQPKGAAEGRENGRKQSLRDGRADDDNEARTGIEKKKTKKRRRLSKHQPGESHAHRLNAL